MTNEYMEGWRAAARDIDEEPIWWLFQALDWPTKLWTDWDRGYADAILSGFGD